MRHRCFTAASVLSLLVFLTTVALGVRSFRVQDRVVWQKSNLLFVSSSQGRLWLFCWISKPDAADVPARLQRETMQPQPLSVSREPWVIHYFHLPGLTIRTGAADIAKALFDVTVSHWLVAFATIVLPARWFDLYRGRRRRETRLRAGCCLTCGYNLTGNTSGTCPECGAACKLVPQAQAP